MLHKYLLKTATAIIMVLMFQNYGFAQTELLLNNEFDDGLNNWEKWEGNGTTGTLEVDNTSQLSGTNSGKMTLTAVGGGSNWELSLAQALPNGVDTANQYHLTFMAKASTNVDIDFIIQETNSPWGALYQQTFSVTTTAQTFDVTFSPTGSGAANFVFSMGAIPLNTQVWFDNVHLVETTTGVNELNLNNLNVFPNPVKDVLGVNFELPNSKNIALSVYDMTGKEVIKRDAQTLMSGAQHLSIDVSDLHSGMYILMLRSGEQQTALKFVIDK